MNARCVWCDHNAVQYVVTCGDVTANACHWHVRGIKGALHRESRGRIATVRAFGALGDRSLR